MYWVLSLDHIQRCREEQSKTLAVAREREEMSSSEEAFTQTGSTLDCGHKHEDGSGQGQELANEQENGCSYRPASELYPEP